MPSLDRLEHLAQEAAIATGLVLGAAGQGVGDVLENLQRGGGGEEIRRDKRSSNTFCDDRETAGTNAMNDWQSLHRSCQPSFSKSYPARGHPC